MSKTNRSTTMGQLHSAARLSRTALASRLLTHGRYAGQDQIMLSLSHEDGQTPGQLAQAARRAARRPSPRRSTGCRRRAFLGKKASDLDARQAHIFLTEPGRDMIKAIEKSVKKTEKQALKGLDKKEQKALAKLLARVEANLTNGEMVEPDDRRRHGRLGGFRMAPVHAFDCCRTARHGEKRRRTKTGSP